MAIERKNYDHLGPVVGPYSHAVKHNGTLYVSGTTAFGSPAQGQSIDQQAEFIFSQLGKLAKVENTSLASLLKVTIFVTELEGIDGLRQVLFRHYGEHLPASSLVQVKSLFSPEVSIEIEAVFAI
ncbi:RidA family protein [Leptothoe sp. ISB3NOV94-8A]|uniref:RidA family protein n=1 Tax=Adonisia turfae CCMR0081 TaxID=2292702 RepID=A0A6M0RLP5_9CYAN|nr:RidA family protein [Adonisia turfae]NEZ57177.1 RidA family protein [Adonisia turfae CCMR0081]